MRLNASQQFQDLKGLGEIVVGADLQAQDFVHQLAARREHHDRRHNPCFAHIAAHVKAVLLGQHHVQDDQVIRALNRLAQALFAVDRRIQRSILPP